MTNGLILIEIPEGEIKAIMDELDRAQDTICKCYSRLRELGVVTIRETPPAATDGVSAH